MPVEVMGYDLARGRKAGIGPGPVAVTKVGEPVALPLQHAGDVLLVIESLEHPASDEEGQGSWVGNGKAAEFTGGIPG